MSRTLEAIEASKTEIYEIAANAEAEVVRVKEALEDVRQETLEVIERVDRLSVQERQARVRLMEVSRDFGRYTEQDIKDAYEKAQNIQIELIKLRERERLLRYQRDELSRSLRRLEQTRERAERLMSQVGVVLNYLTKDLNNLSERLDEVQEFQRLRLRIIEAQEEERRRVAREIHDGPAQAMANIVMRADYCTRLYQIDPGKVVEELAALQQLVRSCLDEVRKIIFDLRPMALDDLGLVPALKRFLKQYEEQYGLAVEMVFFGQGERLEPAIEVALFRVIQEALNNVRKHAEASSVLVKVEVTPDIVNLLVRDNGRGFDVDAALGDAGRRGYGLTGMRERIALLKGQIKFRSAPGRGTNVIINVPLGNKLEEEDKTEKARGRRSKRSYDTRKAADR
ncbi:MAG: histidine kinase [Thermoanaerobacterales bacterium]|nr:histidine kinase [Thermoanaerobacterales bacterium]